MLDIPAADKLKLKYKIGMHFILREIEKQAKTLGLVTSDEKTAIEIMHDDLLNCTNYPIRIMYKKMMEAAGYMGESYQATIITDMGAPVLWMAYRDTAYRDCFFWWQNEVITDPCMVVNLKPYVKPPSMWYCPNWKQSKDATHRKKDSGEIKSFDMSPEEKMFVPKYQQDELDKILKKHEKDYEWKKLIDEVNDRIKDGKRKI